MKKIKWKLAGFFRNLGIMIIIFAGAILLCLVYRRADGIEAYASPVFVLAVLLTSRFTDHIGYGMAASVLGVICVNYFFTYPYMAVNFSISGYPLTFITLLIVSVITGTLTARAKQRDLLKTENEREKIRTDLLRSISHDIRTPLTFIIGATGTVLDTPDMKREELEQWLYDTNKEAQWLLRMVENLLMITKIDRNQSVTKEFWAPEEIIGEAAEKIHKAYPNVPIDVSIPEKPLFVPMDPILIEQVIFNLVENSILHGKNISVVRIEVSGNTHSAVFRISDDGQGFEQDFLRTVEKGHIPEKAASDSDRKRGMGLGLQVSGAIVKAHKGTMRIRNTDEGAEVTFTLPLQDEM